jgi:hypothetical protein
MGILDWFRGDRSPRSDEPSASASDSRPEGSDAVGDHMHDANPCSPLPIYRVSLVRVAAEGEVSDAADDVGLRTKFGGDPWWIQDEETVCCRQCNKPATFIGQIDSFEHKSDVNSHGHMSDSGEHHFMFGDVGMIYVFFCFACGQPEATFQCY